MDKHRNADGSYDGAGALGELTGLGRPDVIGIWEQVKANQAKLDGCVYHEFAPIMPLVKLGQKYRCINCGGEVDAHAYHWHERGRHSRRGQKVDR